MTTIESAGRISGAGAGIFDREHTVAKAGFNRWLACPDITLWQELFTTTCDWKVASLGWMYTLFFVLLGVSAAIWGGWLERAGPRKAGAVAACCWGGGLLIGAFGVYAHQLWIMWLGCSCGWAVA
jgi:MFS family permease